MPFGSVPSLIAGSIGMSLASCGHAVGAADDCGHAGPARDRSPSAKVATKLRAARTDGCIGILWSEPYTIGDAAQLRQFTRPCRGLRGVQGGPRLGRVEAVRYTLADPASQIWPHGGRTLMSKQLFTILATLAVGVGVGIGVGSQYLN